jgi:putative membrane protein
VFTSLALAAAAVHPFGHGFGFLFFLIPLFWILVIVLIVSLVARRRRHWGHYGPWAHGAYGPWGAQAQAARSAEVTLAERFAQGDVDEKEYRARLEVLRASAPQPPMPPVK